MASEYNWYNVYGSHRHYGAIDEDLYIGDVIAKTNKIAKAIARERFPNWKVTRTVLLRSATKGEHLQFGE